MPEISRFYGITLYVFYNEHNPPHFHAEYAGYRAIITIKDRVVKGEMPNRALKLIFEWLDMYEKQLLENWELSSQGLPLKSIKPLE